MALRAIDSAYGWSVVDEDGGRWWPDSAVDVALAKSDDPGAEIVRICDEQPMRGAWKA